MNPRIAAILAAVILTVVGIGLPNFLTIASESDPPDFEKRPVTKKCVESRQTEDPNSPPCIAYFTGDNEGDTWQGVTGDEVRVVIYRNVNIGSNGLGEPTPPARTICDVVLLDCDGNGRPDANPGASLRVANAYSRYLKDRYQTYLRYVHPYIYWTGSSTPAGRRADAADIRDRIGPFAVIDQAFDNGTLQDFASSSAMRNTLTFGSRQGWARAFYEYYSLHLELVARCRTVGRPILGLCMLKGRPD